MAVLMGYPELVLSSNGTLVPNGASPRQYPGTRLLHVLAQRLYFRVHQRADLSGTQWGWCTFTGLVHPRNSAPSLRFFVAALQHAQTFRGSAPSFLTF